MLLVGLLAFTGCGKSEKSTAQAVPGAIDMPKFQQAFTSGTPEQQANVTRVASGVRYRLYPEALTALEKLDGDSTLTAPQKQAINDLIQAIKQAMAKAPAAPPQ